jgi:hypothetical protein
MIYLPLLSHNVQQSTIPLAAAKSAAGRRNPIQSVELTHALAWFFVSVRPSFIEAALSYLLGGISCVMAVRAGQPRGWPGSIVSGFLPLSGLPPMSVGTPGGRENLITMEAAIMATVPTPALPKIFTFLIQRQRACRLAELRRIRTISVIAITESQARANLPGLSLVFMSRTPSMGVAA